VWRFVTASGLGGGGGGGFPGAAGGAQDLGVDIAPAIEYALRYIIGSRPVDITIDNVPFSVAIRRGGHA